MFSYLLLVTMLLVSSGVTVVNQQKNMKMDELNTRSRSPQLGNKYQCKDS